MNKIVRINIIASLFLAITFSGLSAMGVRENEGAYNTELKKVFNELVEKLDKGETDTLQATKKLQDLRIKYDIAYTDEAGVLDSIVDRLGEGRLNRDEAQFYFKLLNEGQLTEYRQQAQRQKSNFHQREVISLLIQTMDDSSGDNSGPEGMLNILNNYYDFVGLEYDEDYYRLSDLIFSLKSGAITPEQLASELHSIDINLASREAAHKQQDEAGRQSPGNVDDGQSESSAQKDPAVNTSPLSSSGSGSGANSGSSGQNPSSGSSDTRR